MSDGEPVLRRYREDDEEELIALWLASTIEGQSFLPEEYWRAMEPEIRSFRPHTETWVLENGNGALVGFMALLENTIGGLFTHPDHQSQGHGARLVAHARTLRDPLFVEVFEVNADAVRFYRRCGFVDHDSQVHEDSGLTELILRMDASYAPT